MANIRIPRGWEISENEVTPQNIYKGRRRFLQSAMAAAGGVLTGCGLSVEGNVPEIVAVDGSEFLPGDPLGIPRNDAFVVPERELTAVEAATRYNNFYEFTIPKADVWTLVGGFQIEPWTIEVAGLVNRPQTFDMDDLFAFELEERIYRHRCVEAWAMTVPWVGFPLSRLLDAVEPLSSANYVRFVSAVQDDAMPGIFNRPNYPWPYHEALRIDEAYNELALLTVGLYGHVLPRQNGAPVRMVLPWKYGYKSIKSIVRIELVEEQPPTFWNTISPSRYSFSSNVNPNVQTVPWSQASEGLILDEGRVDTMLFNGYEEYVADLYPDEPRTPQES